MLRSTFSTARAALAAGAAILSLAACGETTGPTAGPAEEATVRSQLVDPGKIIFFERPTLSFNMKGQNGYFVPGAAVTVTGPNGFAMTIVDGGANDTGGNNGLLYHELPMAGTYQFCEITAPTGYALPNPACGSVEAKWNIKHVMIVQHTPLVSAEPWWK